MSTNVEEVTSTTPTKVDEISPKKARSRSKSLPRGKYTMVGIDIATTGRRLIDEIVQLSAYTPSSQFSQYIIPYMNLNPAARNRHQIRVISVGFFRMMKSMRTFKVLKTKTEIAALKDFLDWLEKVKKADENSNGIILIYHEKRKFVPYMILEAFKKYDLLDRFLKLVRSFTNSYDFATEKCATTVKNINLRQLSKILLNNNDQEKENKNNSFEGDASVRAQLIFDITQHLAQSEKKDLTSSVSDLMNMSNVIYEYSHPVSREIGELNYQRNILEMQNSLRPIFVQYFKITLYHRVKGVTFRRLLAENGHNYESLKKIWDDNKKNGIQEVINKITDLKDDEKKELTDILDCHFDPEKTDFQPPRKQSKRRSPRRNSRSRRVRNTRGSNNNRQKRDSTSGNKTETTNKKTENNKTFNKSELNNNNKISPQSMNNNNAIAAN